MVESAFPLDSRVGKLWQDIQEEYVPKKISLRALEEEINVGFLRDPLGLREFKNITEKIEGPEVLEWCYNRPDCHPLLSKHGFPVPSDLNDYDPEKTADDQLRHEINLKMKPIRQNNDSTVREKGRVVFDWSMDYMQFNGDCPSESPGWAALINQCGYCSESTAAMYYPLDAAGLQPQYFFETDWAPSMRWRDRFHDGMKNISGLMDDHVLLGIPDPEAGGKILFIDRINREFDGEHPFALPLSMRSFAGAVLNNTVNELMARRSSEKVFSGIKMRRELFPYDLFIFGQEGALLEKAGKISTEDRVRAQTELYGGNPLGEVLGVLDEVTEPRELFHELLSPESATFQKTEALAEASPSLASSVYSRIAWANTLLLFGMANEAQADLKLRGDTSADFRKYTEIIEGAAGLYGRALRINPNAVKAFLGSAALSEKLGSLHPIVNQTVYAEAQAVLEKYPDHVPAHFLAGMAAGKLSNFGGNVREKNGTLSAALEHFLFITKQEPEHPKAYLSAAQALLVMERNDEAYALLEKAAPLVSGEMLEDYYALRFTEAFNRRDPEAVDRVTDKIFGQEGFDGVHLVLKALESFSVGVEGSYPDMTALRENSGMDRMDAMLRVIVRKLAEIPRARPDLEVLETKWGITLGIVFGEAVWKERTARISEWRRKEVVRGIKEVLSAYHRWLAKSWQSEEVLDVFFQNLEVIRRDLKGSFKKEFIAIYVELINNYIKLDENVKAAKVLQVILESDSTDTIIRYADRVIEMRYDTPHQRFFALDLLYNYRDQVAPEVLQKLKKEYEKNLQNADAEDTVLKDQIRIRIASLAKM